MGAELEEIQGELVAIVKRLYDCARGLRRLQWQRQADVEVYEWHEATLIGVIVRRLGVNLDEIAGEIVDRTDEKDRQVYGQLRQKLDTDLARIEREEAVEIARINQLFKGVAASYDAPGVERAPTT